MLSRYYVRIGREVRGPVDEASIASWVARGKGIAGAEVCAESTGGYVPLERSIFASRIPSSSAAPFGNARAYGIPIIVAMSVCARLCVRELENDKAQAKVALPAVGAHGVLGRADGAIGLCPEAGANWGWPCTSPRKVAQGAHVEVMKAGIFQSKGVCRYWVQGGLDDRTVGDAPCAWLQTP
jgi:hypothetical protein